MTYKFIERQSNKIKYRFTLKIYRDVYLSDSIGGTFDSQARIGIYISTSSGYNIYGNDGNRRTIIVPIGSIRRVDPPQFPCLEPPSNIAVEEATYEWDAIITDTTTSYVIAYQRCCRNRTISNIISPGTIGSTYWVEITPEAQKVNNSSPSFKSFPPIFICAGEQINYEHSASDIDNDQIVYRFCSPLIGASDNDPVPITPNSPPYEPVLFRFPAYSGSTPLGGNPIVSINSSSGRITGRPANIGQFVVGVCIEEYRNGRLLSQIFRDFQFNVVSCKKTVVAQIEADSISNKTFFVSSCELTKKLQNNSYKKDNISDIKWIISRNSDTLVSSEWNPTFTFRDSGVYEGKLLLNDGTPCTDSSNIVVTVSSGIKTNFSFTYDTCIAGSIAFKNQSRLGAFPLKTLVWDYGDGKRDTNILSPKHQYNTPGIKKPTLFVKDRYNCLKDTSITFNWQPAPPIIIVEPDKFIGCTPATVFFNNKSTPVDSTYKITWDWGDGTTSHAISPSHVYKNGGNYSVNLKIVSPIGCYKEATFANWIRIRTTTKADFDFSPEKITNLTPSVLFIDKSEIPVSWHWNFNQKGYSLLENPTFSFQDTGVHIVKLTIKNQNGCLDSISKNIYVEPEVTFFMPNAFSPNFDSTNDEFKGTGFTYGLKSFRLIVWNRWGSKIFETANPSTGWNGQINNNGDIVPEGVYLYELQYITPKNKQIVKRDFVTLIR